MSYVSIPNIAFFFFSLDGDKFASMTIVTLNSPLNSSTYCGAWYMVGGVSVWLSVNLIRHKCVCAIEALSNSREQLKSLEDRRVRATYEHSECGKVPSFGRWTNWRFEVY